MTSKTVLVKVPNGRNFKVFFSANDNQTDFSAFKESFYKICEKDCDLNILVLNNEYNRFSFRKYDDTFKCMVELTDFEEIPNGAIIELFIFLSVFADIPVKSEETARNLSLDTFSNDDSSCSFNDMNIFLNDTSENNDSINEIMNTTIHNNLSQQSSKFKTSRLVYPCALPEFSPVVKYAIQNGTIQHSYARFVRESAAFLLTMVEQPTRPDYEIFCRTLAEKYDFINVKNIPGIVAPYAVFKKHLSQSVRNARYYSNKKMKSNHTSSDNTEIEGNKVMCYYPFQNDPCCSPTTTKTDEI